MKSFLLSQIFLLCIGLSAQAQDKLIKRNGRVIEGKVTEVGVREIRYQTSSDPNSAKFVIRKGELEKIEFGNGENFIINERSVDKESTVSKRNARKEYGKNIFTLSPFKAIDSGPGLGVSYERLVGENQYLGIILPLSLIFKESYNYNSSGGSENNYLTNFYISPGVKIYPFGQRKVTYAVGPNLMLGFLKDRNSIYMSSGYVQYQDVDRFRLGVIINNYLNFQITPLINVGISGGLGMRYLDRSTPSSANSYSDNFTVTGEFAFNFGFRF